MTDLTRFDPIALDKAYNDLLDANPSIATTLFKKEVFDPQVPLLVIVHPGSLCGSYETSGLLPDDDYEEWNDDWEEDCRPYLTMEITNWDGDIVFVFGEFTDELNKGRDQARRDMADAIRKAWPKAHAMFAPPYEEDLEYAAVLLVKELRALERARVVLTGAWADPGDGCVTTVANTLRRYRTVEIADYTPSLSSKPIVDVSPP
jgi:hypothetical protein